MKNFVKKGTKFTICRKMYIYIEVYTGKKNLLSQVFTHTLWSP